ncbi:MAG: pseudouridine-5'-phosphate glycosidase [Candidatus Cloacimonetes bacterium]|jgi:pseudouridine-5'-phosphate glycosidase|nr:pseudouridine-5'-phosphate glycosidase [Candidatus Cloacimonadota bacterium]MDD2507063.1 pseudouridine-5'-phosphate glycosidase [Candidatus Cloacimonadota bacterium]MDD4148201.1 pseudouridine-5'-phosphate glycosidase [Candidatus Cloacimonadota bacterium]MDD4559835.1 pseudouridine-5'-phosphate glycosidase [Candidatus Cloacimonadota bacterium]
MTPAKVYPLPLKISAPVRLALAENKAIVALESTVITHGLPYPQNLETLSMLEYCALENGATPATICALDGVFHIGLDAEDIKLLTYKFMQPEALHKLTSRDISMAAARKYSGGTTVSATMYLAHLVGIDVFATGGIGGVHRGWQNTMDISLDIKALASIPMIVVCAGCKAILDIPATLEMLESSGVPVYGWQTEEFPSFYSRQSGQTVDRLDSLSELATAYRYHQDLPLVSSGMLIANPIPKESEIAREEIEPYIQQAISDAKGLSGKALTPYLLAILAEITENKSVSANLVLLKNNVVLAAHIAAEL